jgi:predicted DNA-binding protein (MmcQ/YjbR family)
MQINLKHHPNAFENLDQAFDPEANVRYGAFFLKTLYNRCRNWHLAIALYHSNNMIYSRTYLFKVLKELGQKRIDLNCIPPYIIHIFQKNKQIRPGGHLFTSAPHLIQNCTKNKRHQLRKKAELIAKELISKISCQKMSSSVRVTRRQVLLFSKNLK